MEPPRAFVGQGIGVASNWPTSFPRIREVVVFDRHPRLRDLLLGQRLLEEFAGQCRQQRVGDDIVDHPAAGIGIVALRNDVTDNCVVVDEGGAVIGANAPVDAIELQPYDRIEHGSR